MIGDDYRGNLHPGQKVILKEGWGYYELYPYIDFRRAKKDTEVEITDTITVTEIYFLLDGKKCKTTEDAFKVI